MKLFIQYLPGPGYKQSYNYMNHVFSVNTDITSSEILSDGILQKMLKVSSIRNQSPKYKTTWSIGSVELSVALVTCSLPKTRPFWKLALLCESDCEFFCKGV